MPKQAKGNGTIELCSDQRSGEVQYERESFPIGAPDNGRKVNVSLGYRRSLDFDAKDNPGQDFAAVRGDDNGYVVGVVADGVSQSFYGHLAAYYLSEALLDTLWRRRERPPSEEDLERELKELEEKVAAEVVENHPIPEDLVPLLRESLEDKRSKGSQAVFAAFVLNPSEKRLHLYQVGDVGAIVHYANKEPEPIQAPPKGRWSSAGKSEMRLKLATFEGYEDVSAIVIKSDGAGKDWGLKEKALTQNAFALLAEERAGIDDLSFVAARWGKVLEAPETESERSWPTEPLPPPRYEETEAPPETRRYDSDRNQREPLPGTRGYDEVRRGPREAREGGISVRPGTKRQPRRRKRPGNVLLFAAGAAAGIFLTSLITAFGLVWLTKDPPVAKNTEYFLPKGQQELSIPASDLLGDSDADGSPTVEKVREPAKGTLTLERDGSFTYTANEDFDGTDAFKYRACEDGMFGSCSKPATVRITAEAEDSSFRCTILWWRCGDSSRQKE